LYTIFFSFSGFGKEKKKNKREAEGVPEDGEKEWVLARDASFQGNNECEPCTQAEKVAIGDFCCCLLCGSSVCHGNQFLPSSHNQNSFQNEFLHTLKNSSNK
jgi:hypothetical protein